MNMEKSAEDTLRSYSIGLVRPIVEALVEEGWNFSTLAEIYQLPPNLLTDYDDDFHMSALMFFRLQNQLLRQLRQASIWDYSTAGMNGEIFRLITLAIIHCKSLGSALSRFAESSELFPARFTRLNLEEKGDLAILSCDDTLLDSQYDEAIAPVTDPSVWHSGVVVRNLQTWYAFAQWLIGRPIPLEEVNLRISSSEAQPRFRRWFKREPIYDCGLNQLIFSNSILQSPLVQSEATLEEMLETAPYQLVVATTSVNTVSQQVSQAIGHNFRRQLPSMTAVASILNMSASTLRRRLHDEKSTYQHIKDECRRDAAIYYLTAEDLSVQDVAELMGFDEPSAFSRSFKHWTGLAPIEFRAKVINESGKIPGTPL